MILFHYMVADQTGTSLRENLGYYLTYTSNVLFYLDNHLDGIVSHFWSLAVEEQFYLFWPWVMLLLPERFMKYVFVVFAIAGLTFGMIVTGMGGMLTPACFDAFGIGGGLAFMKHHHRMLTVSETRMMNLLTITSIFLLVLYPILKTSFFSVIHIRLPVSVLTFRAIHYCLYENNIRLINSVLGLRAFSWLGKVSYGVYIYHTAIPWTFRKVSDALVGMGWNADPIYGLLPASLHNDLDLLLKFVALLLVSWLSWTLVESPINNLKKYFDDNSQRPHAAL
jgi:peptidoglycan/LPS O-acetylase OafA/YrhL